MKWLIRLLGGKDVSETEIDVQEVKAKLDRGDDFVLVDVREPAEHRGYNIPAAKLIPLGDIGKRLGELDKSGEIVVHCKAGMRSARACGILRAAGFTNVRNMKGGIMAWHDQIDRAAKS
jgi:sulfur-carrier protein adenylyltransferase/sulfurtransferase